MPLLPEVADLLEQLKLLPLFTDLEPEDARILAAMGYRLDPNRQTIVGGISERLLPDYPHPIPLRIYTPRGNHPFPIVVYFHGGGWMLGNLETVDGICRVICQESQSVVISVDYRLAPEYKFPAAVEDAYAATLWASRHTSHLQGNSQKIVVAGDSAGANLAAVVALMARDRHEFKLSHQFLIYPVTNYGFDTPTYNQYSDGYQVRREDMIWFWHHYLTTPADGNNPLASPLKATSLNNLASASIYTAEYDILRSEAEDYGQKLQKAGVPVSIKCYPGLIHGFLGYPLLNPITKPILVEMARELYQNLSE
jgi:acetyl esterase